MIKTLKDYLSNGGLTKLKEKKFGRGDLKQDEHYQIYKILKTYKKGDFDLMKVLILDSNIIGLKGFPTDYIIENHLNDIEIN